MTEVDWKMLVRGLKSKLDPERKAFVERAVREASGDEVPIRIARKRLLSMTVDALQGRPRLVAVHGDGVVVIIAMEDLLEVVAEPGPTLGEVLDMGRGDQSKRRRMSEDQE